MNSRLNITTIEEEYSEETIYVISDLHIMDRDCGHAAIYKRISDFFDFVKTQQEKEKHLILNGDILEFGYPEKELLKDRNYLFFPKFSETNERAVLKSIYLKRRWFWEKLSELINNGVKVTYILGNHDLSLSLKTLQEDFIDYLRETGMKNEAIFRFATKHYHQKDRIYVEHGHRYDPDCVTKDLINPEYSDELEHGLGMRVIRNFCNQLNPPLFLYNASETNFLQIIKNIVRLQGALYLLKSGFFYAAYLLKVVLLDRLKALKKNSKKKEKNLDDCNLLKQADSTASSTSRIMLKLYFFSIMGLFSAILITFTNNLDLWYIPAMLFGLDLGAHVYFDPNLVIKAGIELAKDLLLEYDTPLVVLGHTHFCDKKTWNFKGHEKCFINTGGWFSKKFPSHYALSRPNQSRLVVFGTD